MGLRSFFRSSAGGADERSPAVVRITPKPIDPLQPEQMAELQAAWEEFAKAAEDASVTSFRACTRGGKPWEDDPVTVRALAAMLKDFRADCDTPTADR